MEKIDFYSGSKWKISLLIMVLFVVFVLPVLPDEWQRLLFRPANSILYFSAFFSLEKRARWVMIVFLIAFILEWITGILSMPFVNYISRALKMIFFVFIIVRLIRQIARAKTVNIGVITEAVTGYLLLGLIYAIFVSIVILNDPGSYSNLPEEAAILSDLRTGTSFPLYYSFVTFASLGYGDISPITPVARSLATLIAVSGQMYVAIIIALLVGKFSELSRLKRE